MAQIQTVFEMRITPPSHQTPLSQDDELALMAGYAAAMDASMSESSSTQDVTTAIASGTSSPPEVSEPHEGPAGVGRPPDDWESQTGEDLDNTSLSMCVSEASCKKGRGEQSQRVNWINTVVFDIKQYLIHQTLKFSLFCHLPVRQDTKELLANQNDMVRFFEKR